MVTNVPVSPGDSLLELSGNILRITRRIQGKQPCGDAYMHLSQPAVGDEGVYYPAQSTTTYIRNSEQARLIAQAFTELAEAIDEAKLPPKP